MNLLSDAETDAQFVDDAQRRRALPVPPCPAWCELAEGHEYDDYPWDRQPVSFTRRHQRTIGAVLVGQVEENAGAGTLKFWDAVCELLPGAEGALDGDVGDYMLSEDRLRVVIADMTRAADLLAVITAAQS